MLILNFDPFPVLTTERLVLRQAKMTDVHETFFLRSDPRVMKYIDRAPCQSMEEAAAFIQMITENTANNNGISWAITLKGEDKKIGDIAIWQFMKEHQRAEIGYVLHPDHQGKGLMSEAMTAVLTYAFHEIHLHSIEANTNSENKASQQLLLRHGFVQEAYFRENYYYEGKFLDSAVYSLLTPLR